MPTTATTPIYRFVADRMRRGDALYAVADAARDVDLALRRPAALTLPTRSLFEGAYAASLAHVAPHVVALRPDSAYLAAWEGALGRAAGILIVAPLDLDALREHLRSLFVVRDENGHAYNFRFYDPRVLRVYFPTCTGAEAAEFFGPIYRVIVESPAPGRLWSCHAQRVGVHIGERGLVPEGTIDAGTHR